MNDPAIYSIRKRTITGLRWYLQSEDCWTLDERTATRYTKQEAEGRTEGFNVSLASDGLPLAEVAENP